MKKPLFHDQRNQRKPMAVRIASLALCAIVAFPSVQAAAAKTSETMETATITDENGTAYQAKKVIDTKKSTTKTTKKKNSSANKNKKTSAKAASSKKQTKGLAKKGSQNGRNKSSHSYYSIQTASGPRMLSTELQDHTYEMCVKYGIPEYYGLILSQMWCESGYNTTAVSSSKNYGLMQVSMNYPKLQSDIGLTNLRDPYQNIEMGVYLMASYINKYGDVQAALVCYHQGESAARRGIRSDSYSHHVVSLASSLEEA